MDKSPKLIGTEQFITDMEKLVLSDHQINKNVAIEEIIETSKNVIDSSFHILIDGESMKDRKARNFLFQASVDDDSYKTISYLSYETLV